MRYSVKVEIVPPAGSSDLDGLQREGVISLLFDALAEVEDGGAGADGEVIDMSGASIDCEPGGAEVVLFLEASRLEPAERAAEQIIAGALADTELLEGWSVTRVEVDLSGEMTAVPAGQEEDDAEESLAVVEVLHHGLDEFDEERERTIAAASRLRAFGLDAFGFESSGPGLVTAQLAAGALMSAVDLFMDELFEDLGTLSEGPVTVAETDGLFALGSLPPQYAPLYTPGFARKFLLAGAAVTRRLVCREWEQPACVAEELALRLLIERAKTHLDMYGLLDQKAADQAYAWFSDLAFADLDHEYLYEMELDGISEDPDYDFLGLAPMNFAAWFTSFGDDVPAHPYGRPDTDQAGE